MPADQAQVLAPPLAAKSPARRSPARRDWLLPVAAGVFLGVMAFDLLPAAARSSGWPAALWAVAGFAAMALAGRRLQDRSGFAWVGSAGIWMHSLLEGMVAAAGFNAGAGIGLFVVVLLFVHLIPEATALGAFGNEAGEPGTRTGLRIAVTFAVVALGFGFARSALPDLQPDQLGEAMGLAAGVFAYLALATLKRGPSRLSPTALGLAAGIGWVAILHL